VGASERPRIPGGRDARLNGRLAFEREITQIAARFVGLAPERFDEVMTDSLRRIAGALDVDRIALWQFTREPTELDRTHAWVRPDVAALPARATANGDFPWIVSRLLANQPVWFESPDQVPSATDRSSLLKSGTRSGAAIPLALDGVVVGSISFGALRHTRPWDEEARERIRLLAAILAHALAARRNQEELSRAVATVERLRDQLALENVQLHDQVKTLRGPRAVVAESRAVREVLTQVDSVARTHATVLLLGETGTGKELFAEAVHAGSDRRGRPMTRVNCAAIPTALMESELFGRERGAYTGALSRQIGRFEMANGSTIFLDEIGDLALEAQAKLLRIIQDRVLERLGSIRPIQVDVRIIAATNRDLRKAVAAGAFREDLYYRLNVFPISVPPLRERVDDIPVLVWTFVDEFARLFNKKIESISKEHLAALQRYPWPGNVRELRNLIERAVIMARGPRLAIEPPRPGTSAARESVMLTEVEAEHIRSVLSRVGWRIRGPGGAAILLGMKPTTLDSRMAKLGIKRPGR
jgi:transcriptional regulator with GAF, ATPase, and Fis domain